MAVKILDGSGKVWAVRCCAICRHFPDYHDDPHCALHGGLDEWYEVDCYALCGDFALNEDRFGYLKGALGNG